MDPNVAAFLTSWPWSPWTSAACALIVVIYYRGWQALRGRGSIAFRGRELFAFCSGVAVVWLAACSPLEPFSDLLLSVHMAQHLLLLFAAPVLIWLGAPQLPLMHGLPAEVLECWVLPIMQWPPVRRLTRWITHPCWAWLISAALVWLWHIPAWYELALQSSLWHAIEHASFLASGLLFWWPVVQPHPSKSIWPRVTILAYLFAAAVQATALCAFLTFADRVLYPHYLAVPRVGGMSALVDQEIAGAMMWTVGLVAYLVPMVVLARTILYGDPQRSRTKSGWNLAQLQPEVAWSSASPGEPLRSAMPIDVLRTPAVGAVLTSLAARRVLQFASVLVAAAIVFDGMTGPTTAALNLAGVVPWTHWRGLVVLSLLAVGNICCLACPFTLPRSVARRWCTPRREWPAKLRSKWIAIAALGLFFWAYEALDVWDSPWWTAWIVVGYFVVALAIDMTFRGATFCKYVCPVGQFQFVQSLVAPWQVRVRDPQVCAGCQSRDCIRGGAAGPGCEMQLFVPQKASNLDCTFCLDCVRACPVSNVGMLATLPGRSSAPTVKLTRTALEFPSVRPDVAVLILFLVFAALANAGGMISPVVQAEDFLVARFDLPLVLVESGYLALALLILPLVSVAAVTAVSRRLSGATETTLASMSRFAPGFVPLGAAMWLAHYGFHLVTGCTAIVPPAARLASQWGLPTEMSTAVIRRCCAVAPPSWLLPAELIALDVGLLLALYLLYWRAAEQHGESRRAVGAMLPWAGLATLLFVVGTWILCAPMEMRGTITSAAAQTAGAMR